jgi:hypothetical protein
MEKTPFCREENIDTKGPMRQPNVGVKRLMANPAPRGLHPKYVRQDAEDAKSQRCRNRAPEGLKLVCEREEPRIVSGV